MSKTLGGIQFVRNGLEYDYCFVESIQSLCECCDKVVVVDAGSTDGTTEVLGIMETTHDNLKVIYMDSADWFAHKDSSRLAHFQNAAACQLQDVDFHLLIQSDEIIHESSYRHIREAIEIDSDGFMCSRINLWGSPFTYINLPDSRQPCSTKVIRLAKSNFRSCGDGESIDAQADMSFIGKIRIYHMGFCRKKSIMRKKIINMQVDIFGMINYDPKLDMSPEFDSTLWFSGNELSPISEPLPKIIQKWSLNRP